MALSDVVFTSVDRANPSNSQTISLQNADQTRASDFLTVQSLANFAAMTGAITVAWKALQAVSESTFSARWTPFVMALLWLAGCLPHCNSRARTGAAEEPWILGYRHLDRNPELGCPVRRSHRHHCLIPALPVSPDRRHDHGLSAPASGYYSPPSVAVPLEPQVPHAY
jgi:hypothetical protein